MRILVTGANGLLGQKLMGLMMHEPAMDVIATGKGPCRLPIVQEEFKYVSADLRLKREVEKLIKDASPDLIIHAAAMTQVDQCEHNRELCRQVNVDGTEHIANAARSIGAELLYISTDFVFNGNKGFYVEEDIPDPVNYYGWSKLKGEQIVQNRLDHWAIARTVLVYGVAHDLSRSNLIIWVRKNLMEGKSIRVVEDQWRTPTLVEDLANGCIAMAKNRSEGIYHISGEEYTNPYQIALETARFFNLDESLITPTNGREFIEIGKRPPKTGFIIDKAKKELEFKPHSLSAGLEVVKTQLEAQER